MRFVDLCRWDGRVERKAYAVVGVAAFVFKHLLDGLITRHFLHTNAGFFFNYWSPFDASVQITRLSNYQSEYLAAMLLVALPFIGLGISMTVRRLRDAGRPVWLTALFFVPLINVLFLTVLCLLPSEEPDTAKEAAPWPGPRTLDRIIPTSKLGSALLAILAASLIGLGLLLLGTVLLRTYGWGLFIALPFCLGLFSVLLYSYHAPREFGDCMGVALLPVGILGFTLLGVAIEGLICILMAAPIALALAALGGMLGYTIQASHWTSRNSTAMLSLVLLFMPASLGIERIAPPDTPRFAVRSAIDVNAPPEVVWKQVVAFTQIPPPKEMLFRAGIAYPIRAEIYGHGPGAVRHCVFSTGPFVEPIEIWDEPRLLKFGVTVSPAPLNELTPYGHVDPPHLHGYFGSEEGQFLLTPLPGGGTRLEGTTWYRNAMWPAGYWHLWSDYIIHRIHMRVLEHIREDAEGVGHGR
jgi:uncharacterized membrane protein YhaH (DUF805 family)